MGVSVGRHPQQGGIPRREWHPQRHGEWKTVTLVNGEMFGKPLSHSRCLSRDICYSHWKNSNVAGLIFYSLLVSEILSVFTNQLIKYISKIGQFLAFKNGQYKGFRQNPLKLVRLSIFTI